MPEFPISEIASPQKCMDIFRGRVEYLLDSLPKHPPSNIIINFSNGEQDFSLDERICVLEINMVIGPKEDKQLETMGFFDSINRYIGELSAKMKHSEKSTVTGSKIHRQIIIEFTPFESSPLMRACDFEDDFNEYITGKYYSPQQAIIEQSRSTTELSESEEGCFVISGQVGLDSESEVTEIQTFRDLDREKRAIIRDLGELASRYRAKLDFVYHKPSVICFEVIFKKLN